MSAIQFIAPPLPHYIVSGEDTYAAGDSHPSRKEIGVFDLIIVTRGALHISEEPSSFEISSGHYLLLRPDRSHRTLKPCSEETHFYWLHFQTVGHWNEVTEQQSFVHHPQANPFVQFDRFSFYIPSYNRLFTPTEVYELMRQINLLTQHPLVHARWKQQVLFQELLLKLQEGERSANDTPHILVAEQAAAFLRRHYRESVSYSELAQSLHFHPNYIARCMKRVYGCTPHEFLTRYRIEQAKLLLIHTDDPIGKIAEDTGFGSFPFFVRCFAKHTGARPREYRMRYRGS